MGPKGSGKTHIGSLIEKNADVVFLRVESIWLRLKKNENGWKQVVKAIDLAFRHNDTVMVEHLGVGNEFHRYLQTLRGKYRVKMIHVFADPALCLERVLNRDSRRHIPVSDDRVAEYNRLALQVTFDWDLEIDNNGPASEENILSSIRRLLSCKE